MLLRARAFRVWTAARWPVLAQVCGVLLFLAALGVLLGALVGAVVGVTVAVMLGGLVLVAVGTLREAGRI